MSSPLLEQMFPGLQESGIRIERVGGLTVWEAQPVFRHQAEVFRIQSSIRPIGGSSTTGGCGCVHVADCAILFPDGSQKRPDISIFCRVPDETDSAVTLLPEAVIEVISKDYEAKEYLIGVTFYLQVGVKDVITLDPRTGEVRHYRPDTLTYHTSPIEIMLQCGCICQV